MRIRLKPGAKDHAQSTEPEVQATQTEAPGPAGYLASAPAPASIHLAGVGNPAGAA